MFYRFPFESEIYPDLSRIPLHVRMKLDLAGVKISLKDWLAYSMEERGVLCHLPVDAEEEKENFVSYLDFLSRRYHGKKTARVEPVLNPPWDSLDRVPDPVEARSKEEGEPVMPDEWKGWNICQRYAAYKLSISKNEPEKFREALQEFREQASGNR